MEDKILVFLSRPNPFIDKQQIFLENLQRKLSKFDFETVTLQADNYDLTDSLNYLKGMIKQCYGIVIVGFRQIFIEKGSKKKGGIYNPQFFFSQEIDVSGQALTSPFCHIEGTIGLLNVEDRGRFCVLLIDIHEEFCIELFLTIGFFCSTLLLEEDDLIVTDLSVTGFDPLSEYLPSSFIFPSIRGRFSD